MDEFPEQHMLSPDEQAILRAFNALDMTNWERPATNAMHDAARPQEHEVQREQFDPLSAEDLLVVFVHEVDEDLTALQRVLAQLKPDEHDYLDTTHLRKLKRSGHKIKGTTAAMGCTSMATLASYIEVVAEACIQRSIPPNISLTVLTQALDALQRTFENVVRTGKEENTPTIEFEEAYAQLHLDRQVLTATKPPSSAEPPSDAPAFPSFAPASFPAPEDDEQAGEQATVKLAALSSSAPTTVRVDIGRFEQLLLQTERLADLHAEGENAQAQVELALSELHTAQVRLHHLESVFSAHVGSKYSSQTLKRQLGNEDRPASSLISRILTESAARTGHLYQRKSVASAYRNRSRMGRFLVWDELEIDRFSESDVLTHSLSEAIADVTTASAQLRLAFTQLRLIMQKQLDYAQKVRSNSLLLRQAPLRTLVPSIEQALARNANTPAAQFQFTLEGEAIELDQSILEAVKPPLLQLVRAALANSTPAFFSGSLQAEHTEQIWLRAQRANNTITLEVGFSLAIEGGIVDEIQASIQRLHGSISVRRNEKGGVSFFLHLPSSQGTVQGLLVRSGKQQVVIPFFQVQRIDDGRQHVQTPLYTLDALLDLPEEQEERAAQGASQPVLLLEVDMKQIAVQVDEIVGDIELVMKPLARHLQRPGITGTAIDGTGNILLMLDLPALLAHYETHPHIQSQKRPLPQVNQIQRSVLIADDSVFIRQSLQQVLQYAGYHVTQAHDGIETLEQLLDKPPDALLLDIEMPNLNGYDVLSILRVHPELAHIKIIMLTSRSLEKHQLRTKELGAHAYLIKPCSQEVLLETLDRCFQT